MTKQIKNFLNNDAGAETLEYVVIVAVILVAGAAAYNTNMATIFNDAFTAITAAIGGGGTTG